MNTLMWIGVALGIGFLVYLLYLSAGAITDLIYRNREE